MSNYCIHIPDERFREILEITGGDRELTSTIWSLSKSKTAQKQFGFSDDMDGVEVLQKLGNEQVIHSILGNESYARFVTKVENLDDKSYKQYNDAQNKQSDILTKHKELIPVLSERNGSIKINVFPNNKEFQKSFARQKALERLNSNLINYIEKLGFTVREVENLESPGVFCPLDAETNANGLKEAIKIAKGQKGQEILPEEISHLLVEGFQNNIFMQRLMNAMDEQTVMDILGGQYDQYESEYDGDEILLKKEAIGRLVAQYLVDRNGIGDQIRFISDKMLDKMRNNLRNGSESDIDVFLSQLDKDTEGFIESVFGDDQSIDFFDHEAVANSKTKLNHLEARVKSLQDVAEESYNITAKRMKILSLKNKDMKLSKDEMLEFNRLKSLMEQKDYANSSIAFIEYALKDSKEALDHLEQLKEDSNKGKISGLAQLRRAARIIRQAEDLCVAYRPAVQTMAAIDKINDISQQMLPEQIEKLKQLAIDTNSAIAGIDLIISDMRVNTMLKLLQNVYGDRDISVKNADGTERIIKLQDILESCTGETKAVSRLLNSLADAGDPFLQLMDQMYKGFTNQRDQQIFALQQELAKIQQDYLESSGSRDMKVFFVRDENGKITGMLKSNRDFLKYHREKAEYRKQLKQSGLSNEEIKRELKIWDMDHTEQVNVAPEGFEPRIEIMPRLDLYKSNDLEDLTDAQLELYNKIIDIKKRLDYLLPTKYTHLYRAPMKKGSVADQALSGGKIKGMWNRIKSRYITDVPEYKSKENQSTQTEFGEETQSDQSTEYGESVQIDQYSDGKHVVLDFSGKEVRKVPVFYTKWLDDMSALDTNLIDTMLSYGAMALNYQTMNSIADFMELGNSQMQDRNIIKTSGVNKMFERFKLGDIAFQKDYTIPGSKSENAKVLRQYIDRNVYGLRKNKESIIIGGKEVNYGSIGDALKSYSSVVGLGLNIFSGTTNLTMGIAQTLIQCAGKQYFRIGNVLRANARYFKGLPMGIIGQYSDEKKDKLNLLIQKFDCLEEYYNELDDNNFYGGIFKKMVGKWNPMILNSMGEHYLHSISMLAMLDNKKVKIGQDGKLISLYDALEVKESKIQGFDGREESVYKIEIPEGLLNEDGTEFTERDMMNMKSKIQEVNHKMHGAFNDVDRGEANRWVIGRMLMQFRQWMPAFYTSRFRNERINIVTGETEEGFYRTYFKFITGFIGDLFRLKFNFLTRFRNLTDSQKANVRMAFFESSLAILLLCLTKMKFMKPDKDDPAFANIIRYNLYRLKMELGAAAPTSLDFIDNIKTLVQSPIPATENIDRLISVLDITLIGGTVKSGRYEGWNKYVRNLYFATPMAKNIGRVIDLTDGDISMFNPYTKH